MSHHLKRATKAPLADACRNAIAALGLSLPFSAHCWQTTPGTLLGGVEGCRGMYRCASLVAAVAAPARQDNQAVQLPISSTSISLLPC